MGEQILDVVVGNRPRCGGSLHRHQDVDVADNVSNLRRLDQRVHDRDNDLLLHAHDRAAHLGQAEGHRDLVVGIKVTAGTISPCRQIAHEGFGQERAIGKAVIQGECSESCHLNFFRRS